MIDKKSFALLKIFYKHKQVSKDYAAKKFHGSGLDSVDNLFNVLDRNDFITAEWTSSDSYGCPIYSDTIYNLTNKGRIYVEERLLGNRRWRVPVIISIIALIFSAIAIAVSILTLLTKPAP